MPPRKFDPRPGGANGEDGEPVKIEGIIRTKNGMGIGSFSRGAARRHMAIEEVRGTSRHPSERRRRCVRVCFPYTAINWGARTRSCELVISERQRRHGRSRDETEL